MNNLEKFIQSSNKNLYQCIIDLALNKLFNQETVTFLLPDNTIINNIVYNYIHNTEESIVQIKSLFIKGYIPNLDYFSKVDVVTFTNQLLTIDKKEKNSTDEKNDFIMLCKKYKITKNTKYKKQLSYIVYNLECDKLPLTGKDLEKAHISSNKNVENSVNINYDNIKKKLRNCINNNYYSFLKKDINIFRVICNLIFNGLLKNHLNDNTVVNRESQSVINNTNVRLSYLSRATFYLLTDSNDNFNVFQHINVEIFKLIENIIKNEIEIKMLLKCDSSKIYNNLLSTIKNNSLNEFTSPTPASIKKITKLSQDPANIDFISSLKNAYKKTYNDSHNIILNNHILTILCEMYISMETNEINNTNVKSGYNEFKNNFLVFIQTTELNTLDKYSTDIVKMYSIFNTLTKCQFFLKNISEMVINPTTEHKTSAYYRNPNDNNTIFISENEDTSNSNSYDDLLQF